MSGVGMWLEGLVMLAFWGALIDGAILVVRHLGGLPGSEVRTSPLALSRADVRRGSRQRSSCCEAPAQSNASRN